MRNLILSLSVMVIILVQTGQGSVTASDEAGPSQPEAAIKEISRSLPNMTVNLSTATGKSIIFKPEESEAQTTEPASQNQIPHLVLFRNGVLTPGYERTLQVSVGNLSVPASGMYVQLIIETQHGDPDWDRRRNVRVRVWKETRFVPYHKLTQQGVQVAFNITFGPLTEMPHKTVQTPTDYFRYRISIADAQGSPLHTYAQDYAFLMENQWTVPLPQVLEATPGAAPDELMVYYYDMIPFQRDMRDPRSRIARQAVDRYIQTELIPAMVEAYRVQSDVWGFAWYEEWRNFRRDESPKTLSVALGEYRTWYHGQPASLGHSMISIRVDGTAAEYENLTDGIMSIFHHELFHNHQRNMSLHFARHEAVAGKDEAWMMFSEGTAVLASAVGQPHVQLEGSAHLRSYPKRANAFLGSDGSFGGGLNKSYTDIPYQAAVYWRFLYENCGGLNREGEDPAAGMQIIRQILETLYRGEVVDIRSSLDVASGIPAIISYALQSSPSCEFQSYEESLIHFARAIYLLRFEAGRCQPASKGRRCGFMDPHSLYTIPPADQYAVTGDAVTQVNGSIPSSFGIDLVELDITPITRTEQVKLIFASTSSAEVKFHVQVWTLTTNDEAGESGEQPAPVGEPVSLWSNDGSLEINIDTLRRGETEALGLIIVRIDPFEEQQTTGAYSIHVKAQ
ncbi:MAG TPA: hypothetical protein VK900_04225 [Anaerolineales bacterium]|nr:hypothetical protein [Anaerolineales bacterium]